MSEKKKTSYPGIRDLSEKQIAEYIIKATGIPFKYDSGRKKYLYTKGKLEMDFSKGNYSCDSVNEGAYFKKGDPLIHVGYWDKTEGAGRPCDTIDEAVQFFVNTLTKYSVAFKPATDKNKSKEPKVETVQQKETVPAQKVATVKAKAQPKKAKPAVKKTATPKIESTSDLCAELRKILAA